MSKWKSGDLVRLKSGGPTMTVDKYVTAYALAYDGEAPSMMSTCGGSMKPDGENVRCVWFPNRSDGEAFHVSQVEVHEDALEAVTP